MTKTKEILLTLRPVDQYFFGGEETFEAGRDGDTVRNYLVRSNKLPQQTALVGLIRHVLYLNGLEIGQGFDLGRDLDFGALHRISPLFLQKGTDNARQFYWPAPMLTLGDGQEIQVKAGNHAGFNGEDFGPLAALEYVDGDGKVKPYSAKEYLAEYWAPTDKSAYVAVDDIFISKLHIGIDKASRMQGTTKVNGKEADEDGFYKQEFYQLAEDYRFAVLVEIDDSIDTHIFNTTIQFGGENRAFVLQAEEISPELKTRTEPSFKASATDRIVLTSDALVAKANDLYEQCLFVSSSVVPFRYHKTPPAVYAGDEAAKKEALANLHRGRSERSYLLRRGSVFYPKNAAAKATMLDLLKHETLQAIGYNHFHA